MSLSKKVFHRRTEVSWSTGAPITSRSARSCRGRRGPPAAVVCHERRKNIVARNPVPTINPGYCELHMKGRKLVLPMKTHKSNRDMKLRLLAKWKPKYFLQP